MRKTILSPCLLIALLAAGCVVGSGDDEDASVEPDGAQGCEVSTDCAADEYCVYGECEARPKQYDSELAYPDLDTHEGVCRVVMYDDYNGVESTLQVEQINNVLFVATNGVGSDNPWSVEAVLYGDGELEVDAGVPDVDYEEILEEYALQDVGQLRFDQPNGYACSEFEQGLIFFLIMEWFFFG